MHVNLEQNLYFHIRHKYVIETEKCSGPDSTVGKYERAYLEIIVKTLNSALGIELASLADSKQESDKFFAGMNQLLKTVRLIFRLERRRRALLKGYSRLRFYIQARIFMNWRFMLVTERFFPQCSLHTVP